MMRIKTREKVTALLMAALVSLGAATESFAFTPWSNINGKWISADGKTMAQITAPPEYWPYYLETYDKTEADVEASFQESCQEKMSDWQSVYGSDVTISYRIVGLSRPDENGLEEWNQNMESLLGNTGANISEAVTLEVEQTLSGSTKKGTETVYPTLAKMGDSWYIMETDNEKLQNPAGQSDSSSQS